MKTPLITLFIAIIFVACQGPAPKQQETASTAQADQQKDQSLLNAARNFFQPLPLVAENTENPITPEKVNLGKLLYYDTHLSKTGKNSCNSCHNLATYGVDNKPTSTGDAGKNGERNSPTVLNAALHTTQFWDGRAKDVEEQAGMPIMNPVEMAIPHKDFLVKRLASLPVYKEEFSKAFPADKNPVTFENLQKAIAAFERTLLTPSKFDKFLGGDLAALTAEEKKGLQSFMDEGCTTCHNGPVLGGNMFMKFGLVADYHALTGSNTKDEGRKNVTKQESDKDMFKVPGLRNITETYPYFHDGSVAELDKAIQIMSKVQMNKDLSADQVNSIITFLKTLKGEVPEDAKKVPDLLVQK